MLDCLIAAGTPQSARAGAAVAARGGNAIDAAVAAAVASWVCEPGMTALGSAVMATVRASGEDPVLVDGLTAMPGLGGHQADPPGGDLITMPYGPGVQTRVGPGSIAVPGGPASLHLMQSRWGRARWSDVLGPAIAYARDGFAFPSVGAEYMAISGEVIYDRTPGSREVWRGPDGKPRQAGDHTTLPALAEDLRLMADAGVTPLYEGALGERITDWILAHGGAMSMQDLSSYEVGVCNAVTVSDGDWHVSMPESVGGLTVRELVSGFASIPRGHADEQRELVRVMQNAVRMRDVRLGAASASTTQICAVDQDGGACSITTSTGYGSGVIVPGTGIMLNNMLGELELLPSGPGVLKPGDRLPSNMSPSIAWCGNHVIAMGAAGSDRIPPAIAQVWRHLADGVMPEEAIARPRMHVRSEGPSWVLDHEGPCQIDGWVGAMNPFDGRHMYFGGVQVAARDADGVLAGAGDPRRGGGVAFSADMDPTWPTD